MHAVIHFVRQQEENTRTVMHAVMRETAAVHETAAVKHETAAVMQRMRSQRKTAAVMQRERAQKSMVLPDPHARNQREAAAVMQRKRTQKKNKHDLPVSRFAV